MASGTVRARPARAKATTKATTKNNNTKWVGKKHRVSPGDVVRFHSAANHILGAMGTVIGYVSKNEVLVQTFGGADEDFPPIYVSLRNQAPNENYQGRGFQAHYQTYITKVIFRPNGKPTKKRKPVLFHEVTHEDLPAVLTGEQEIPEGHKVVLVPTPTPAP